jgi:cytochrome c oxidase cbb3-type subunit 2
MNNLNLILAGVFSTVAASFGGLLLAGHAQLGTLGRAPAEEGGPLFPALEPGLAIQGRQVYLQLGCVACHTQQVRPAGQGSDIAQGWGVRPSVARDYVLQSQVALGNRRIGPDLANYGARAKADAEIAAHLSAPAAGSAMPAFPSLFNQGKDGSLQPNERGTALIAYLKSLRQDYSSPEAKLKQ